MGQDAAYNDMLKALETCGSPEDRIALQTLISEALGTEGPPAAGTFQAFHHRTTGGQDQIQTVLLVAGRLIVRGECDREGRRLTSIVPSDAIRQLTHLTDGTTDRLTLETGGGGTVSETFSEALTGPVQQDAGMPDGTRLTRTQGRDVQTPERWTAESAAGDPALRRLAGVLRSLME